MKCCHCIPVPPSLPSSAAELRPNATLPAALQVETSPVSQQGAWYQVTHHSSSFLGTSWPQQQGHWLTASLETPISSSFPSKLRGLAACDPVTCSFLGSQGYDSAGPREVLPPTVPCLSPTCTSHPGAQGQGAGVDGIISKLKGLPRSIRPKQRDAHGRPPGHQPPAWRSKAVNQPRGQTAKQGGGHCGLVSKQGRVPTLGSPLSELS